MRELRTITVAEIREGDEYVSEETGTHHWTATEDARVDLGQVRVTVQFHPDGGLSTRVWDAPIATKATITVVRDWPEETVDL